MRVALSLGFLLCQVLQVFAGPGTTAHLTSIARARCYEYPPPIKRASFQTKKDCDRLVDLFIDAFKGKAHCEVTPARFQRFIDEALKLTHPVRPNKGILWSRTLDTVRQYGNRRRRYVLVNDLLPGTIVNGLTFCGSTSNASGIDHGSCPEYNGCGTRTSAVKAFWSMISEKFAASLQGVIPVLLNGTIGMAYRNDSIFTTHELPNLNTAKVTLVRALLIHSVGKKKREDCNSGSLLNLKKDVESRRLKYECVENPNDLRHLLCVDHSNSHQCMFKYSANGAASTGPLFMSTTAALMLAALYITVV